MPYKQPPKCVQCEKTESILWRNLELGVFCQECFEKNESQEKNDKPDADSEEPSTKASRKATRSTRAGKTTSAVPKGKGRRCKRFLVLMCFVICSKTLSIFRHLQEDTF